MTSILTRFEPNHRFVPQSVRQYVALQLALRSRNIEHISAYLALTERNIDQAIRSVAQPPRADRLTQ